MYSEFYPKSNVFSLILGTLGLLVLLPGCPTGDITLPGINQDPTANAGADRTIDVGQRVTLNAIGSTDADDDALTFVWQQRSGPPVTLDGENTAQPSFVPAEDGFYEFALTVTDGRGGSDISVVRVFVGDVDPATCPRADAGTDQTVNEGAAVRLRGGNSADPGGGPLTFDWFQLSGPQVSINGVFIAEPSFAAPQAAGADVELEFELTVTNEQGCPDRDTVVITVRDRDASDPCNELVCNDDGLFCNGVESCDGGSCVSSGDPCAASETCDEETDLCAASQCTTNGDCDDSNPCTTDTCTAGTCTNVAVFCDAGQSCNGSTGICEATCTVDAECDDGLFCNGSETCVNGFCQVGTASCATGETCDEDNDSCTAVICTTDAECDDMDACTIDSCTVPDSTCANVAVVCDAGQACNSLTGACEATCAVDVDCADTTFCNGVETCTAGFCQTGPAVCAAGEACDEATHECTPVGPTVFFDDFEGGLGNWFADNGIWEVGVPSSGPNAAHSPENVAATVLAGNYPDGTSSRLVSPSIQLPALAVGEELHLRFWHWFAFAGSGGCSRCSGDDGRVQIREETAPGEWGAWTELATFGGSSGVYTNALVDLSAHAGKKVQIGFRLRQGPGAAAAGWYIDDVVVSIAQMMLSPFSDDFEGGLGNWFADNGIWEVGVPSSGPSAAHSPENVAATVLAGNYPDGTSSRLVSPSIQLPALAVGEELHLRFWHWFAFAGSGGCSRCSGDDGRVQIREETAPGEWGAWTELATFGGSSGVYTNALVDLSAHAGKKVQIGFRLRQGPGAAAVGWYIDDVTIEVF